MTQDNHTNPQDDSRWYRDEKYSMEDWGYEARNGDDPPDYLFWVQQKYEMDDSSPPQSLLDEIARIGGVPAGVDIYAQVPDEFLQRYPVEDWQHEAENNDTRLGYRTWLAYQLYEDEEWQERQARQASVPAAPTGPKGP